MPAEGQRQRTGGVWVPDWPVVAAVAEGVLPAHLPAALHDGRGMTAVSAQARRLGVRRGMKRRSAQSIAPDLVLGDADPTRDARAFEPALQALESVAAHVVLLRPGLALIGVAGAVRYHRSEEAVAEALIGATVEAGIEAQVGIATGFLTGVLAARESLLLPEEDSKQFLSRRGVADFMHAVTTEKMRTQYADLVGVWRRLGLSMLGDVAKLSVADVGARFGETGLQAHRLARGLDIRLRAAHQPEADISAGIDLDPPAERIDAAAFAAREVAARLHDLLLHRGVACEGLRVEARAENGVRLTRVWRVDALLSVNELTDRVRWQLGGWLEGRSGDKPSAPLVRIDLTAEGNYPAGSAQTGLWGHTDRGRTQAARAAVRVQSLLGAEGVLAPVVEGGRTPRDRIRYVAWGDDTLARRAPAEPWPGHLPSPLPTTLLEDTVPVNLIGIRRPVRMTDRSALSEPPVSLVRDHRSYPVTGWAGPWPMHERWWAGQVQQVYLQVVCQHLGALLLAGERGQWWIEGAYD